MLCPACQAAIADGSRFCGICGTSIDPGPGSAANPGSRDQGGFSASVSTRPQASRSMMLEGASLFELPVAPGAKAARVVMVLILDAALLIAGIALILSYLDLRAERLTRVSPPISNEVVPAVEVEELAPTLVKKGSGPGRIPVSEAPPRTEGSSAASPSESPPASTSGSPAKPRPGDALPSRPPTNADKPGPGTSTGTTPAPPDPDSPPGTSPGTPSAPADPSPGSTDTPRGDDPANVDPGAPPGDVTDEDIGRFTSQIALLVRRNRGQLERCYTLAAKVNGPTDPLQGKVEIQFTVSSNGSAQGEKVVANSSGSDQLGRCVAGLVASWSFPPPPASEPVELIWAFPFKAMR